MAGQSESLTESSLLRKTSCPSCGSSDANAIYDDGHSYCYSCGTHERGEGGPAEKPKERRVADLIRGEYAAIPTRKIDLPTCEKYGYQVGEFKEQKCHIAPYYDDTGAMVAQKIRLPGKDFLVLGKLKSALPFFGQNVCRDGGKMIVVTEGEIDALSVTQAMGLKWPAVSVPNGADGAARAVAKGIQWLESFEKVVFLFDQDEPGRAATAECVSLLSPGKAYVATIPLKDANEMVKAGRSSELVDAIWSARLYRPEAVVDIDDILESALEDTEWGLPWPWRTMTAATYGTRRSALYVWGAGTGSGKTTLMKWLMTCAMRPDLIEDHTELLGTPDWRKPRKVASLFFEEPPKLTLRTMGGMVIQKRVHVPGTPYDKDELREALEGFKGLFFPLKTTTRSFEDVKANIRYLVHSEGVRDFFIDPMTALVATVEDERRALDAMMAELAGLAEDLDITIHLVSHLATPEGKSHEDGGRVSEKHFRGSRSVAFWAHYMIGLERDKQDPNCPITVRGLKDRLTGDAVGPFIYLKYDKDTGRMVEVDTPDSGGFKDETEDEL